MGLDNVSLVTRCYSRFHKDGGMRRGEAER